MLTYESYLSLLKEKLSCHFDLIPSVSLGNRSYDLYGTMNIHNTKYLLSEKIRIYGYENDEYLWLRKYEGESLASIKDELIHLTEEIPRLISPGKDHMSSQLTLLLVGEEIPPELTRLARRFRHQKGFALGFKGWADLILVMVSLKENRVVTHRHFRKTAEFFQPERIGQKEKK
ncbi:MAG: hypothetical protein PQJ60_05620 [Spirochaetales bacterium]|nr:hypothetical protein [Spirochaetales bacterium]